MPPELPIDSAEEPEVDFIRFAGGQRMPPLLGSHDQVEGMADILPALIKQALAINAEILAHEGVDEVQRAVDLCGPYLDRKQVE